MGGGKTSFLEAVGQGLRKANHQVLYMDIKEKLETGGEVFSELARALEVESGPRAVVLDAIRRRGPVSIMVDDCHNMFLRRVGGFGGLRAFLDIMIHTQDDAFWVTTWADTSWAFLAQIFSLDTYFSHRVALSPATVEELTALIKHELRDIPYDVNPPERNGSGGVDDDWAPFFRRLREESAGNVTAALKIWLASCSHEPAPSTHKGGGLGRASIEVKMPAAPKDQDLTKLPAEEVFGLAAIVQNGPLSSGQLAAVTNVQEDTAQVILTNLTRYGLLRDTGAGGYTISVTAQQPVRSFLVSRRSVYVPGIKGGE